MRCGLEAVWIAVNDDDCRVGHANSSVGGAIDSAVQIVQIILNKDARDNLRESFESINRAIHTFEKTSMRIDTLVASEKMRIELILRNVESISDNIRHNNDEISKVISNFAAISDSIAKSDLVSTVNNANNVLADMSIVLKKIERGEGSLGMLIHDDQLYNELVFAAADLNLLAKDIRLNPGKYMPLKRKGKKKRNERPSRTLATK